MFRWLFRTLFLLVLVLVGLMLARNRIGAWLLRSELERVTGLPCAVGTMNLHLSSPLVEACAISIHNPPYSCRIPMALGIRSLSARYDPWALLRGRLHLSRLDADIAVVNCVRSPEGPTNLRSLHDRLLSGSGGMASLEVREFSARIETTRYVDESRGPARVQKVRVHEGSRSAIATTLHGEEALLKSAASLLAQVQAADPFEAPAPAPPKLSPSARKAKSPGQTR